MGSKVSRRDALVGSLCLTVPGAAACDSGGNCLGCDDELTSPSPAHDAGTAHDARTFDAGLRDAARAPDEGREGGEGGGDVADAAATALVVEVGSVVVPDGGVPDPSAVQALVTRGMCELTGLSKEGEAWRTFFDPADVVGIKVNPVGWPVAYSHIATVAAIVRGLNLAGVSSDNIIVFDRYADEIEPVGYAAALPSGVQVTGAVPTYSDDQTDLGGYDPAVYVDLPGVHAGDDPRNPQMRRSYLCQIASQRVTKIIGVPSLKDHPSAGITCALKNVTYGLVNNVSRTHQIPNNWTQTFLPAVFGMDAIRKKVVLHIADALVACYDGGPGPGPPNFSPFDYGALFFARDPVALDRVTWQLLDSVRATHGLPPLADTGVLLTNPSDYESFNERQPQYILECGSRGLGVSDLSRITHRVISV